MINIYVVGQPLPSHLKFVQDVEALPVWLDDTEAVRGILWTLEKAKYHSKFQFVDRFGGGLYVSSLSTGCKAALAVVHYPELLINFEECGGNAISSTLAFCKVGNIRVPETSLSYPHIDGKNFSVAVRSGEYMFDNLDRLSFYITDEYPDPPYLPGGVYHA